MRAMWFLMLLYKIVSPRYQIVSLMSTTLQKAAQGHIKLISFCCFLSLPSLNMFLQNPPRVRSVLYTPYHEPWMITPLLKKITETGEGIIKPEVLFVTYRRPDTSKPAAPKDNSELNDFFFFFATNNWLIRCLENETLNLRFSKSITMNWLSNTDECKRN